MQLFSQKMKNIPHHLKNSVKLIVISFWRILLSGTCWELLGPLWASSCKQETPSKLVRSISRSINHLPTSIRMLKIFLFIYFDYFQIVWPWSRLIFHYSVYLPQKTRPITSACGGVKHRIIDRHINLGSSQFLI